MSTIQEALRALNKKEERKPVARKVNEGADLQSYIKDRLADLEEKENKGKKVNESAYDKIKAYLEAHGRKVEECNINEAEDDEEIEIVDDEEMPEEEVEMGNDEDRIAALEARVAELEAKVAACCGDTEEEIEDEEIEDEEPEEDEEEMVDEGFNSIVKDKKFNKK